MTKSFFKHKYLVKVVITTTIYTSSCNQSCSIYRFFIHFLRILQLRLLAQTTGPYLKKQKIALSLSPKKEGGAVANHAKSCLFHVILLMKYSYSGMKAMELPFPSIAFKEAFQDQWSHFVEKNPCVTVSVGRKELCKLLQGVDIFETLVKELRISKRALYRYIADLWIFTIKKIITVAPPIVISHIVKNETKIQVDITVMKGEVISFHVVVGAGKLAGILVFILPEIALAVTYCF
ncbi:hypothetical protein BD770DRAFT_423203 [Pilaira anomala]|nr:hypothetical protein BD770DRAFT_423203 [Pilaira anomala]